MGNIISYLKWRGDIAFTERGFSEADNLVLSALAYVDFNGIVSQDGCYIELEEAAGQYFEKKEKGAANTPTEDLLFYMGKSKRFQKAHLSDYCEITDEERGTQFAAVQISLGDGTCYLAFRGTDETIVGWQEDFSISFQVVPSQKQAVKWLETAMTEEGKVYRVGGHSKGGNLALYAAMMCRDSYKEQILSVYMNDSPGICPEMLDREKYLQIRDKIVRILPGFSVIGKLFEPDVEAVIIESSQKGILQHDIMNWQIAGEELCIRDTEEVDSRFYNDIFDTWIDSADMEQRETFTRDFFNALRSGGAKTMQEIAEGGLDSFGTVLVSIAESESRTKIVIGKLIKSYLTRIRKVDIKELIHSKEGLQADLFLLAGIICMLFPTQAVSSIGIVLCVCGVIWSGKKILEYGLKQELQAAEKRKRLLACMVIFGFFVFLATHAKLILISGNVLIGFTFMIGAFRMLRRTSAKQKRGFKKTALSAGWLLVFALGCVSLVTPEKVFAEKMIFIGSCFVLYGVWNYLKVIFDEKSEMSADI